MQKRWLLSLLEEEKIPKEVRKYTVLLDKNQKS